MPILDGPGGPLDEASGPGKVCGRPSRLESLEPGLLRLQKHIEPQARHPSVEQEINEGVSGKLEVPLETASF
jgi:hypothetical protein